MAALAAVLTASCSPAGRELVQVDFQEFFNSDTVSLSIEGQTVMPAQVLTSDATGKACRTVRLCAPTTASTFAPTSAALSSHAAPAGSTKRR